MWTGMPVAARQPGEPAAGDTQRLAGEQPPGDEQALIAEARARARRRRLRIVIAVSAAAVMALAGVLIGYAVPGPSHPAATRPVPAAIRAGVVTGHLAACTGLPVNVITPGTVTVLRGTVTWKLVSPGTWRLVLPAKVVTSEHISNNYDQMFRFTLPPGKYVLAGRYDRGNAVTFRQVQVSAGQVIREDLPDVCS
jgi:hypothetical protein